MSGINLTKKSKLLALILRHKPEQFDITLDAEGYAREVMRNIQQLRKKAGLEKLDSIVLLLKVSKEMKEMLEPFKPEIEEKIGADKMEISIADSVRKHEHQAEFKVKWEKFSVWFSKV